MSDRYDDISYSERDPNDVSNRTLLANALETAVQNDIEKKKLAQYKEKIALIEAEEKRLGEIRVKLFSKGLDSKTMEDLQFEMKQTSNRINTYDRQLLALETSKPLKDVLEREKKLAYQRAVQRGRESLAKYREEVAERCKVVCKQWEEQRAKAIEGVIKAKAEENKRAEKEAKKQEEQKPKSQEVKQRKFSMKKFLTKIKNIEQYKKRAFIISLLLCSILYLAFLTLAFTEKRDTYICYTTKTGECYHAYYCSYLKYSSHQTTVYQAERKKYRRCSSCNPFQDRLKTTITVRNYLAPALISIPISAITYIVIKKNKENDNS